MLFFQPYIVAIWYDDEIRVNHHRTINYCLWDGRIHGTYNMQFPFSYSLFITRYVEHTNLLMKVHDLLTLIHITRVSVIDLIIYITFARTVWRWEVHEKGGMEYNNEISGHNCFYALFLFIDKKKILKRVCMLKTYTKHFFFATAAGDAWFLFKINISFAHIWMSMLRAFIQLTGSTGIFISLQALRNFFVRRVLTHSKSVDSERMR